MKRSRLIFLKIGLSIFISLIVFYTEKQINMGEDDLIFALVSGFGFFIGLNSFTKRYLVGLSVICFILMAIFYLFWQMNFANWIGSVGLMYLIFYILENLGELFKQGYIQTKRI